MVKMGSGRRRYCHIVLLSLIFAMGAIFAARAEEEKKYPDPTYKDTPYGPYERNILDFWKAPSDKPTPLIVEIHGGGFWEGSKERFRKRYGENIEPALAKGVSLASINYRFIDSAPLYDILRDSARAIQFLRSKSEEWNIDKTKVASFGESAGASTSLWMAFHDDLADPNNPDPVLRESTRLTAAGALSPQATYDFTKWPSVLHIPQNVWRVSMWYICPSYYHCSVFGPYTEKGRKMRADLDFLSWLDPNDPPVYIRSTQANTDLSGENFDKLLKDWAGREFKVDKWRDRDSNFDILHHPAHGHTIEKACKEAGVSCTAIYKETPEDQQVNVFDFLEDKLLK
jgi:acetyl esterase/lipase